MLARNLVAGRCRAATVAYWLDGVWNLSLKMRGAAQVADLGHARQNGAGEHAAPWHVA